MKKTLDSCQFVVFMTVKTFAINSCLFLITYTNPEKMKVNDFYFTVTHNIRVRCRGMTEVEFLTNNLHNFFFFFCGWGRYSYLYRNLPKMKQSITKFLKVEKLHPLTVQYINVPWTFTKTEQKMWGAQFLG